MMLRRRVPLLIYGSRSDVQSSSLSSYAARVKISRATCSMCRLHEQHVQQHTTVTPHESIFFGRLGSHSRKSRVARTPLPGKAMTQFVGGVFRPFCYWVRAPTRSCWADRRRPRMSTRVGDRAAVGHADGAGSRATTSSVRLRCAGKSGGRGSYISRGGRYICRAGVEPA